MTSDELRPVPPTYPLPAVDGDPPRFTLGLVLDVAAVLERHGYPPIRAGADLADLQQALFRFIYVERGAR